MPVKTLGLVTRFANYKDNDRILTLLSPDYGRLSVSVRGCRKTSSKLLACSQLFCYGEYLLYEKNARMGVMSCDIHKSFFGISKDVDAFSAASMIVKICEEASNEQQPEPRLFSLAVYALDYIESGMIAPKDMAVMAIIKVCGIIGYQPGLDENCASCGLPLGTMYLDAMAGGLTCKACALNSKTGAISRKEVETIKAVLSCPNRDLRNIKIPTEQSRRLFEIMNEYISFHFEKKFKSAEAVRRI